MKLDSLENLFVHELHDLLSAEKQLVKALPENGQRGRDLRCKMHSKNIFNKPRATSRALNKSSSPWARLPARNIAKRWRGWSKKARICWRKRLPDGQGCGLDWCGAAR